MIIFDLRLVILAIVVLLVLCVALAIWLDRALARGSAHRERERQLVELRRKLQAAQQDVRLLSHEVRTPLTAIQGHVEVLRTAQAVPMPDEVRDASLNLIGAESQRISHLLAELVELGRLDLAEDVLDKPVDLMIVVEDALAQVAPHAAEKGMELSLDADADADLPRVPGDANRLKRVFLNLLDNAVKYCRPGDHVTIVLKRSDGAILCEVRDTGPGIPQAHLPYVTRRLYRARTDVEGSGLGLAIVEEILRLHRSKLIIESETEGAHTGATFRFVLPLYSP